MSKASHYPHERRHGFCSQLSHNTAALHLQDYFASSFAIFLLMTPDAMRQAILLAVREVSGAHTAPAAEQSARSWHQPWPIQIAAATASNCGCIVFFDFSGKTITVF
jgi:hypothetical protein